MTEGLDPQEKEINAEVPVPPVNLGKNRAILGSRSGIRPHDLRVDQEQVQDPSSPAEHCRDPHCGDRHLGSPPLGGGTTLATELSGTSHGGLGFPSPHSQEFSYSCPVDSENDSLPATQPGGPVNIRWWWSKPARQPIGPSDVGQ